MAATISPQSRVVPTLDVHPHWLAVMQWARENPYGSCEMKFQDGLPVQILEPKESVIVAQLAQHLGLASRKTETR